MVIRHIVYPKDTKTSVYFQTQIYNRNQVSSENIRPFLDKFGYRLKYFRIYHKHMDNLTKLFEKRDSIIELILSKKLPYHLCHQFILPYLV